MAEKKSSGGSGLIIVGCECFVTADPKVFELKDSDFKIISIPILIRRNFRDFDKRDDIDADFWEVSYFVNKKNKIDEFLQKGSKISISGRMTKEYWKNDDREKPPNHVKIKAQEVSFLSGGKLANDTSSNDSQSEDDDW